MVTLATYSPKLGNGTLWYSWPSLWVQPVALLSPSWPDLIAPGFLLASWANGERKMVRRGEH